MANLPGEFKVAYSQDPRLMINEEHFKRVLEAKATEDLGAHAYKKAEVTQITNPTNHMVESRLSVCILSLDEMRNIHIHIKNLETEILAYKNMVQGRAWE